MNKAAVFFFLGALLLLGAGYYLSKQNSSDSLTSSPPAVTDLSGSTLPQVKVKVPVAKSAKSKAFEEVLVNPVFVHFLRTESMEVEAKVNPEESQQHMEEQMAQMGEAELIYAKERALSEVSSAKEKILSVYLLAGAKQSTKVLQDFISAPLKGASEPEPHTIEETKSMQEKTLRVMAIDALAERAVKDSEAREALLRLAESVQDAGLRDYILRKTRTLPSV